MRQVLRRVIATTAAAALATGAVTAATLAPAQADEVTINLLGINDFHGRIDSNTVKFAGTVETLRDSAPAGSTLFISNGDNIGGSLFASAVQDDAPTIEVLNALDLDASSVGNHEFDKGVDDLLGRVTDLADFPYLAANVNDADGSILPAYEIFDVSGVSVAVIGAVTEETPALVSPAGIAGLSFDDLVGSVNATVAELEGLPDAPDVIVATVHEGAPDGAASIDEAIASSPVFAELVQDLDPAIDAIFTGHTHQEYFYEAPISGEPGATRPVIQSGSFGDNISQIQLSYDTETDDVTFVSGGNVSRVSPSIPEGASSEEIAELNAALDAELIATFPRVAEVAAITDEALEYAAVIGDQQVAEITADITTAFGPNAAGILARDDRAAESTLGGLVADALLASVAETPSGADIALVNPGGLRAELLYAGSGGTDADGVVTYAEANSVLPFTNSLVSVEVSVPTLKEILEQQWQRDSDGEVPSRPYLQLGTSANLTYTFDGTRDEGDRITQIFIEGEPIDDSRTYKIATFSFLAAGGDNFRAFTDGVTTDSGLVDYEAWIAYLEGASPITPDFGRRSAEVIGLQDGYDAGDEASVLIPTFDLTSLGAPTTTSVQVWWVPGAGTAGDPIDFGEFPAEEGGISLTLPIPADAYTGAGYFIFNGFADADVEADPVSTSSFRTPEFAVEGQEAPVEPTPTPPVPTPTDPTPTVPGDGTATPTPPAPTADPTTPKPQDPTSDGLPSAGSMLTSWPIIAAILALILGLGMVAWRRHADLS